MTAPNRNQFTARVVENRALCREHFRLVLRVPSFPSTAPGQFVQVLCRDVHRAAAPGKQDDRRGGMVVRPYDAELLSPVALLRRPFSLAERVDHDDGVDLHLVHRVVGVGTAWMGALKIDDKVDLLGPLGNRFELPGEDGIAILVGGGVGIPPMLYLASALDGRKAVAFSGALCRDLLPLDIADEAPAPGEVEPRYNVGEFSRHGIPTVLSTDDGSYGFRGFITQALERYLDASLTDSAQRSRAVIYTCGPEPMMQRVVEIALQRNIECQVAVERAMACGLGTCQSCVIRLRRDPERDGRAFEGRDWIYKLACTDGPVFRGADLLW